MQGTSFDCFQPFVTPGPLPLACHRMRARPCLLNSGRRERSCSREWPTEPLTDLSVVSNCSIAPRGFVSCPPRPGRFERPFRHFRLVPNGVTGGSHKYAQDARDCHSNYSVIARVHSKHPVSLYKSRRSGFAQVHGSS
jgi:hypothetical protein